MFLSCVIPCNHGPDYSTHLPADALRATTLNSSTDPHSKTASGSRRHGLDGSVIHPPTESVDPGECTLGPHARTSPQGTLVQRFFLRRATASDTTTPSPSTRPWSIPRIWSASPVMTSSVT